MTATPATALEQRCEDHDSLAEDDPRLIEAVDILVKRLVSGSYPNDIAQYARELYVRDTFPGSSLPKAVIFAIYKHQQFSQGFGSGTELTQIGDAIFNGQETEGWPGEGQGRGPTASQMFEVYSKRYQNLGP
jgi:hypothetical protein